MTQTICISLRYDGTNYLGFQKCKEGPSIESSLSEAFKKSSYELSNLRVASRTDRGVHANAQVISCEIPKNINITNLQKILNSLLPEDIQILSISKISHDFHPSLSMKGTCYKYRIYNDDYLSPFESRYSWHIKKPLDIESMIEASQLIIGEKDFSCFCNTRENLPDSKIRTIFSIDIENNSPIIQISICGDNFLYKMARNIVGTLCYVGLDKITLHQLDELILGKDRTMLGVTAPAKGLFLHEIFY